MANNVTVTISLRWPRYVRALFWVGVGLAGVGYVVGLAGRWLRDRAGVRLMCWAAGRAVVVTTEDR